MNTDTSQSRRSFIKCFASALVVAGCASVVGEADAIASPQGTTSSSVPMDDDSSLSAGDDLSDPGWSY